MKGLDTEIPEELEGKLNANTVAVLALAEKNGFHTFMVNLSDGNDLDVLNQLKLIAEHVSYLFAQSVSDENQYVLVIDD